MPKRVLNDRRALVTGASSGIGRALSIELARHGADVVLFARREDRLTEVAREIKVLGRRAVIVVGDVTDTADRQHALDAAHREFGGLDILVNNAGTSAHGRFADADPARLRPIFETNFFAPIELTRAALPLLRESSKQNRQPAIVNIGSILGERASPHKSEYSASKFALHGFSEALRAELAKERVDVLVVAAGPTQTEFFNHLLEDQGTTSNFASSPDTPERVATAIVRGIERGHCQIIIGLRSRCWLLLNRLMPRLVDRIMERFA